MNEFAKHIQSLADGTLPSTTGNTQQKEKDLHFAVKTAWEYMVPCLRRDIEAIQVTLDACGDLNTHPVSESLELLNQDHETLVEILDAFVAKWPEPITIIIEDKLAFDPHWMQYMEIAKYTQHLPHHPMTLINDVQKDGTLIFKDGDTFYKVPNIWYNQPGKRIHKVYPW